MRIKEAHSKLNSFQASLCTLIATDLTLIYVYTFIRLSVPLGCLIKQAEKIIRTILNLWKHWESGLTSAYKPAALPPEQFRHKRAIPPFIFTTYKTNRKSRQYLLLLTKCNFLSKIVHNTLNETVVPRDAVTN